MNDIGRYIKNSNYYFKLKEISDIVKRAEERLQDVKDYIIDFSIRLQQSSCRPDMVKKIGEKVLIKSKEWFYENCIHLDNHFIIGDTFISDSYIKLEKLSAVIEGIDLTSTIPKYFLKFNNYLLDNLLGDVGWPDWSLVSEESGEKVISKGEKF